jgi:hypothetical protein
MSAAELLLAAFATYLAAGLAFGLAFVTVGVGRIDPAARGTPPAFRALILPGSAVLWPLLAGKWVAARRGASQ